MKDDISSHLSDIYNISFSMGIFHQSWKLPISFLYIKRTLSPTAITIMQYLPIIEKILENLVYNSIAKFLYYNNLIYPLQFDFWHNYSTNHALINLTEDIRKSLDEGKVECAIFVDLQKAFDTVDHNISPAKLEHFGIRGVTNDWFKSNLSDRGQFFSVNQFNCNRVMFKFGVPQGSELEPILFLIYIADLNLAIKYCKVHHFADDTNFLYFKSWIKKLDRHETSIGLAKCQQNFSKCTEDWISDL